ncbi:MULTISPECIES: OmpH family outer membrane protein [Aquitalea]|uniref:Periplasmic chaperone for outer membrane proteins Skp n=1 Tax=Aquitalea magnusonii TaxID=332411 RepID=A0A318JKW5_9NEIS|nr:MULTISPECIES: OmpH family outer membrane protein [Aquitalea]PXX50382.1 periplasmic chaperone for outer membrane proteins Skp [Aquitalea magnusonii]
MKSSFKWWLAGLALLSLQATAADFKLGFVNIERVYREAAPAIAIQKKLDKEFADRRAELKKMENRAKELEVLLAKSTLSIDDRKRYEREYAALDRDYRAKGRELSEDFNQRRNEEFASVQERANRVLRQIADREQYDLILQDVVYVNPKFDLTGKVLKELEK